MEKGEIRWAAVRMNETRGLNWQPDWSSRVRNIRKLRFHAHSCTDIRGGKRTPDPPRVTPETFLSGKTFHGECHLNALRFKSSGGCRRKCKLVQRGAAVEPINNKASVWSKGQNTPPSLPTHCVGCPPNPQKRSLALHYISIPGTEILVWILTFHAGPYLASAETPQTGRGSCREGAPFHHSVLKTFLRGLILANPTPLCSAEMCPVHLACSKPEAVTRRRTREYGAGHYEPVLGTSPRVPNWNAIIEKGRLQRRPLLRSRCFFSSSSSLIQHLDVNATIIHFKYDKTRVVFFWPTEQQYQIQSILYSTKHILKRVNVWLGANERAH